MNPHAALIAEAFNKPHLFEPTYAANVFQIATQRFNLEFSHSLPGDLYDGETGLLVNNHETYMRAAGAEQRRSDARWYRLENAEHIGVLPIIGSMIHRSQGFASMDRTYSSIEADYEDLMSDQKTRAVVIEMDSPGGTVAGAFSALEFFREHKVKPVHVLVNERMMSGGLLLGSFADSVTMLKTAVAGSLGVIVTHLNVSERMAQDGVKATMIFSGAHKADGNPYGELPDAVVSRIKADLDSTRLMFAESVSEGTQGRTEGRPVSVDELLAQEAQIYRGALAVESGLATGVTISPSAYYRAIADQHSSGANANPGAAPEQTTTDDDADQGDTATGQFTEPEMSRNAGTQTAKVAPAAPKTEEQIRAEVREEMEQEQREQARIAEDRRIQAEADAAERKDKIEGHELAKLRPKMTARLIEDETISAEDAIKFMSMSDPEVTAPHAAATGSVVDALGQTENQPGIDSNHVPDTGGATTGAGEMDAAARENIAVTAAALAAETGMSVEDATAELIEAGEMDGKKRPALSTDGHRGADPRDQYSSDNYNGL